MPATLPDTGSKPAWETFGKPTGEHQVSHSFPPATPKINQHSLLGRLMPATVKKQQLNNQQGTENQHTAEGWSCWKHTREGGRSKELISA
jgi:hypothetical protein